MCDRITILSTVVLLLSCKSSTEPGTLKEFFPLKVGNTWIYEVAFPDTSGVLQVALIETTKVVSSRTQGTEQFYVFPFLIPDPYGWVNRSDGVYVNDPRDGPVLQLVFKNPVGVGDQWNFQAYQWAIGVWSVLSVDSTIIINSSSHRCVVYALAGDSTSSPFFVEFVKEGIGIVRSQNRDPSDGRILHEKSLIAYQLQP